jgi:hypothetical protein
MIGIEIGVFAGFVREEPSAILEIKVPVVADEHNVHNAGYSLQRLLPRTHEDKNTSLSDDGYLIFHRLNENQLGVPHAEITQHLLQNGSVFPQRNYNDIAVPILSNQLKEDLALIDATIDIDS